MTDKAFHVEAYEKIDYSLVYVDGAFAIENTEIADSYQPLGRCLMVVDEVVHDHYRQQMTAYFDAHGIDLTVLTVRIKETDKTLRTLETIVDAFGEFGLLRTEPVLVVGGGLVTDVAGLACATYRRSSNYIRVPTTLIGLIDASVSIKVAVNHGKSKNRLGAYHASQKVILDFSFLRTLPTDQVRNGMAELLKIAVVANGGIFDLLEEHGEDLLRTRFGHLDGSEEIREVAHRVTYDAIDTMLRLEVPNLQELDLDRVIAFGVRGSLAPDTAAARLGDLFDAHHYTRGLSVVPQGTPTNNTPSDRAASINLIAALVSPSLKATTPRMCNASTCNGSSSSA